MLGCSTSSVFVWRVALLTLHIRSRWWRDDASKALHASLVCCLSEPDVLLIMLLRCICMSMPAWCAQVIASCFFLSGWNTLWFLSIHIALITAAFTMVQIWSSVPPAGGKRCFQWVCFIFLRFMRSLQVILSPSVVCHSDPHLIHSVRASVHWTNKWCGVSNSLSSQFGQCVCVSKGRWVRL